MYVATGCLLKLLQRVSGGLVAGAQAGTSDEDDRPRMPGTPGRRGGGTRAAGDADLRNGDAPEAPGRWEGRSGLDEDEYDVSDEDAAGARWDAGAGAASDAEELGAGEEFAAERLDADIVPAAAGGFASPAAARGGGEEDDDDDDDDEDAGLEDDELAEPESATEATARLREEWLAASRARFPPRPEAGTRWDIGLPWQMVPPDGREMEELAETLAKPRALIRCAAPGARRARQGETFAKAVLGKLR
jgi:hypothetical protein